MKKVKFLIISALVFFFAWSCSTNDNSTGTTDDNQSQTEKTNVEEEPEADPKGIGEVKNVELTDPLEESMVARGKAIYDMKCSACHKLTDQRVVGPGWAGVTNKRRPEWIMNMITNVDVMLEEDPVAQELLEQCLTRMPNQGVSIGDARDILEFMRKNDVEKVGSKDGAVAES